MNNKKLTYGLVGLVLIIWGVLIFRVVDGLSGSDDLPAVANDDLVNVDSLKLRDFDYELSLNYRDPFLGYRYRYNQKIHKPTPKKSTSQPKKRSEDKTETPLRTGHIQYHGVVVNKEKGNKVAIMTVNGKGYLANLNEEVENITVEKIFEDSIMIRIDEKTATIRK